ncbi:UPF0481 protein At3g47200-like isoform X3 [Triticum urartu]|uniref:UPF0481 protein At3g47200-like isoform X3 n=1 Tax=Triticum urartu TaxID=4572 RepID=UPI00204328B7|nr:UPF0481 protein At3g47200-like isoform X3 [Triticum urartu]
MVYAPRERGGGMTGSGDVAVHIEHLARSLMQKQEDVAAEEQHRTMVSRRRVSRVPARHRDSNPDAYTPWFVAIGPLHNREDRRLRPAERLKVAYLNSLISHGHPDPTHHLAVIQEYVRIVAGREQEARAMYASEEVVDIATDDFILMMVLDGCFIIEHLVNVATARDEPSLHATPFGPTQLSVDLILAENQMPFFVLVDLIASTKLPEFECMGYPAPVLLMKLVLYNFAGEKGRSMSEELLAAEGVSHVLHLLHEMVTAARTSWWRPIPHILDGGWEQAVRRLVRGLPSLVLAPLLRWIAPEGRRGHVREDVPSASDMKRMRLEFKKARVRGITASVAAIASVMGPVPLVVELTDGDYLVLPQLRLEFRTAPLLLNLMAFERSALASAKTLSDVSAYMCFMTKLVQTAEDAGLVLAAEVVQQDGSAGNQSIEEVVRFFRMVGAASELAAGGELLTSSYLCVLVEKLRERSRSWTYADRNYYTFLAEFVALVTFVSGVSTILQTYAAFKYH